MADRKISDLTALTAPASGDYLPIVDISEGAAASKNKRVTIQSLFQGIPVAVTAGVANGLSGDVLIGNYNSSFGPYFKLSTNNIDMANGGLSIFTSTSGSLTEKLRIDSSGNVGIGATTSLARLTIEKAFAGGTAIDTNTTTASTTYNAAIFRHNSTAVGQIAVSTTATSYITSSDYRLKENVTAVIDGITRLQQLKPSRFNFIADPDHTVDGFLAHEAQAVVPECVTGEKDAVDGDGNPKYQGIDQSKLVPLLTAALQEAIARIETLEAAVAALSG